MKRSKSRHLPKARTSGILTREIPGELLIYDMKRHAAYCLNETAASIWKQCNGKRTIIELVRRLEKSCKVPVDERIVWLALNQLEKRHLLDPRFSFPSQRVMSRRGLMSSLGLATAVGPAHRSLDHRPNRGASGHLWRQNPCGPMQQRQQSRMLLYHQPD